MDESDVNKSYMKSVAGFLAVLALLGGFFGAYRFVDSRFALASELAKVEKRLDVKIADDQRFNVRQEMRQLEEINLGKIIEKWSKQDRDRYNDLKDQLQRLQDKLKSLQ
jgi:hypothetical protein